MIRAEFVPLADRRFVSVECDLTEEVSEPVQSHDPEAVSPPHRTPGSHAGTGSLASLDETDRTAAAIAERLPLAGAVVRVRYRASEEQHRRVDHGALMRLLEDAGAHKVYGGIQWLPVRASRARVAGVDESLAPLAALDLWLGAQNGAVSAEAAAGLRGLLREWAAA